MLYGIALAVGAALLLFTLGTHAARAMLGVSLIMLPLQLLLLRFDVSFRETLVFSFVLVISIFPTLVWSLGFIIPFKMAVFTSVSLFWGLFAIIPYFITKNKP